MSDLSSVEYEYCKELAMPPGGLFEVTSRFLGAGLTSQLLAVYALRDSISLIPLATMDDTVKWAKLKWWSEELCEAPDVPERHPVLRALQHSGARQKLNNNLLLGLVGDAVAQIDAFPEANSGDLIERFANTSKTDILLEAALSEVTVCETVLKPMSRAMGAYTLVVILLKDYPNKTQLLPLNWLAEFQVRPEDLKSRPPANELIGMVKRMADQGVEAYRTGFSAESTQHRSSVPRHLRLRWSLEARYLARVARDTGACFNTKSTYGLSDVWFAWKFCRKE